MFYEKDSVVSKHPPKVWVHENSFQAASEGLSPYFFTSRTEKLDSHEYMPVSEHMEIVAQHDKAYSEMWAACVAAESKLARAVEGLKEIARSNTIIEKTTPDSLKDSIYRRDTARETLAEINGTDYSINAEKTEP